MFWERFYNLCIDNGTKPNAVAKQLGFSSAVCTQWKQRGTTPKIEYLQKIAAYFGVSVDYLTGQPDPPNAAAPDGTVYYRPVFNSVSAGFGAYADSDVVRYEPLVITNPYDVENTICINVRGDSMYPDIPDGSTVVVRKQDTIESGQIGVVLVGDEGFVKRVEIGADFVRLISTNPEYPPRTLRGADLDNVRIVGRVQKLIRNL